MFRNVITFFALVSVSSSFSYVAFKKSRAQLSMASSAFVSPAESAAIMKFGNKMPMKIVLNTRDIEQAK